MKNFINSFKEDKINLEDFGQAVLGAAILATPTAFTEELWRLGEVLPIPNIIALFLLSILIIGFYIRYGIFEGAVSDKKIIFITRILFDYLITFIVVAIILLVLNKISFTSDYLLSLKRIIILSFPASMGAAIVDGFDKE